MTYEQFISRLENVKKSGDKGVTARCPSHRDEKNSLSVTRGDDRVLVNCFAGCSAERICDAWGCKLSDLFYEPRNGNGARPQSQAGLTLEQFSCAKKLPVDFLAKCGVHESGRGLIFQYLTAAGQKASRQRIRIALTGDRRFLWNKAEGRPVPYGLWHLDGWRTAGVRDLILCEGESDCLSLWLHGYAALGVPGADQCSLLQTAHVAGFQRIIIAQESDQGGETFAKGCAGRLAELDFDGRVVVAEFAKMSVKDCNELHVKFHEADGFRAAWNCLVEDAREVELPRVGLDIMSAAEVKTTEIAWLWPNRIALGKLTVFAGDPNIGKSFVTQDIAARLSTASAWPDGSQSSLPPCGTLFFASEDDPSDTTVPRLTTAGADLSKIYISRLVKKVQNDEIVSRGFNLSTDLPELEAKLKRYRDLIRAVVIDPFSAYLGGTDSYKNAEMRGAILEPLARLAAQYHVAIILITHFSKSSGDALSKIAGSVALAAAARTVWVFVPDPERSDRTLMLLRKMNIAKPASGLAFSICEDESGRPVVAWSKDQIDQDADQILRDREEANRSGSERLDQACALLREVLADGELHLSSEVSERAARVGVSDITLRRARKLLGVTSHKSGGHANVKWWLSLTHTHP